MDGATASPKWESFPELTASEQKDLTDRTIGASGSTRALDIETNDRVLDKYDQVVGGTTAPLPLLGAPRLTRLTRLPPLQPPSTRCAPPARGSHGI